VQVVVVVVLTLMGRRALQRLVQVVQAVEAQEREAERQLQLEPQTLVVAEVVAQETEGLLNQELLAVLE
jgi:hypothetical protein